MNDTYASIMKKKTELEKKRDDLYELIISNEKVIQSIGSLEDANKLMQQVDEYNNLVEEISNLEIELQEIEKSLNVNAARKA